MPNQSVPLPCAATARDNKEQLFIYVARCAAPPKAYQALCALLPKLQAQAGHYRQLGMRALVATLAGSRAAAAYLIELPHLADALLCDPHLVQGIASRDIRTMAVGLGLPSCSVAASLVSTPKAVGSQWLQAVVQTTMAVDPTNEHGYAQRLRALRTAVWLRCLAREMAGLTTAEVSGRELAQLAEELLAPLLVRLRERDTADHGPLTGPGEQVGLVLLAQGKLGANDLNISSDIDVQWLAARVDNQGRERPLAEAATRLTQVARRFVKLVAERDAHGFLYRVDQDLRPFGRSGPLINSVLSAYDYYESCGAHWERLALVRARPVAGDSWVAQRFLRAVEPFIWPKGQSAALVDEIRDLRHCTVSSLEPAGQVDLKRSAGGIRDIELFVQLHQVLLGGRLPALREANLYMALTQLQLAGAVSLADATVLRRSYSLLRRIENSIQAVDEQQSHCLPNSEQERDHLANVLCARGRKSGLRTRSGRALARTVAQVLGRIRRLTARLSAAQPQSMGISDDLARTGSARLRLIDRALHHAVIRPQALKQLGFSEPKRAAATLSRLRSRPLGALAAQAHAAPPGLDQALLAAMADSADPSQALKLWAQLEPALTTHRGYWSLLAAQPQLRRRLVDLLGASALLGATMVSYPELLDWLVHPTLEAEAAPGGHAHDLSVDLAQRLDRITTMPLCWRAVATFVREHTLRIGLANLARVLSPAATLRALGALAQTALQRSLTLSVDELAQAGSPIKTENVPTVMALGRLGIGQMAYGSDVDLLFVGPQDEGARQQTTAIARHLVTRLEGAGTEHAIYRVDLRLRPFGGQGPLVTTASACLGYLRDHAKLWERQAWLKARPLAGDLAAGLQLLEQIHGHFFAAVGPKNAAKELVEVRSKMLLSQNTGHIEVAQDPLQRSAPEHGPALAPTFDLKMGPGGLADIELGTQLLQLTLGHTYPALQVARIDQALVALAALEIMPTSIDLDEVSRSWQALRCLELAWRIADGARETTLPMGGAPLRALALRLGYLGQRGPTKLKRDMARHMRQARSFFKAAVTFCDGPTSRL